MVMILYAMLLFLIIITILINRKFMHPFVIFGTLWLIIITFSLLGLYNMNKISETTYYYAFCGIFAFFIGTVISAIRKNGIKKIRIKEENKDAEPFNINWKFAYITLFISLFGTSILFFNTVKYLMNGYNLVQIHNMFYGYGDDTKLLSDIMNSIISWISVPCLYVSLYITIISFFEKNIKKSFFILSILSMIFYLFGNASRIVIIILLFSIVVVYDCYKDKIDYKLKKKTKKYLILGIILFLILMIARKGGSSNKVNTFYAYLTVPLNIFDYWINNFKMGNLSHTYGGGFFFGIISWINWFTTKVGFQLPIYAQVSDYVINTQNTWITVFPGKSYNAFCSIFYYFYLDFGLLGIIFETMIFGFVTYTSYYKAIIKRSRNSLLVYLLVIQTIIFSFVRWQFATAGFIVEIIMTYLILSHKKLKD